ncbi:hypothetical protein HELRODRAFT_179223 [Helobdella robusta]|uniref:Uncharacterized protein n=1 Tax=Helobdella robusta TaxID=6412 RepID=T1FED8_HELRO|nr:hypothetical protein HELRODRAFT_179223 [Helobdella robusta]ESN95455.1 hypothetical protein HELRODRAFT_179223 [Helobdella robusta]
MDILKVLLMIFFLTFQMVNAGATDDVSCPGNGSTKVCRFENCKFEVLSKTLPELINRTDVDVLDFRNVSVADIPPKLFDDLIVDSLILNNVSVKHNVSVHLLGDVAGIRVLDVSNSSAIDSVLRAGNEFLAPVTDTLEKIVIRDVATNYHRTVFEGCDKVTELELHCDPQWHRLLDNFKNLKTLKFIGFNGKNFPVLSRTRSIQEPILDRVRFETTNPDIRKIIDGQSKDIAFKESFSKVDLNKVTTTEATKELDLEPIEYYQLSNYLMHEVEIGNSTTSSPSKKGTSKPIDGSVPMVVRPGMHWRPRKLNTLNF